MRLLLLFVILFTLLFPLTVGEYFLKNTSFIEISHRNPASISSGLKSCRQFLSLLVENSYLFLERKKFTNSLDELGTRINSLRKEFIEIKKTNSDGAAKIFDDFTKKFITENDLIILALQDALLKQKIAVQTVTMIDDHSNSPYLILKFLPQQKESSNKTIRLLEKMTKYYELEDTTVDLYQNLLRGNYAYFDPDTFNINLGIESVSALLLNEKEGQRLFHELRHASFYKKKLQNIDSAFHLVFKGGAQALGEKYPRIFSVSELYTFSNDPFIYAQKLKDVFSYKHSEIGKTLQLVKERLAGTNAVSGQLIDNLKDFQDVISNLITKFSKSSNIENTLDLSSDIFLDGQNLVLKDSLSRTLEIPILNHQLKSPDDYVEFLSKALEHKNYLFELSNETQNRTISALKTLEKLEESWSQINPEMLSVEDKITFQNEFNAFIKELKKLAIK